MFVYLERNFFLITDFRKAVDFLFLKLGSVEKSLVVLPCSLHDLAIQSHSGVGYYSEVDYCTCDSMFLTYYFRNKYKKKIDRVYGPDLMKAILNREDGSTARRKYYFLSSSLKTSDKLSKNLKEFFPKIIADFGFLPKNISQEKEEEILQKVLKSKAKFIWLGIGSPKQIKLATYLKKNSRGVKIFCVGAAFDFLSGEKKQAPILMQRYSLEWLFRLVNEPKRLWKRYLITIPLYLTSVLWRKIVQNGHK